MTVFVAEASYYAHAIHPPSQFFYALSPYRARGFYSHHPFTKVSEENFAVLIKKIKGLEVHDDEYGVLDCKNNEEVPVPCAQEHSSSWGRKGKN